MVPAPRINITVLADPAAPGPLLGYGVLTASHSTPAGHVAVMRQRRESEADVRRRALALAYSDGEGILRIVTEIRGR
jgi:hypothetical protein